MLASVISPEFSSADRTSAPHTASAKAANSAAGVLKTAPHKEAAVKFLEYLASPKAQRYFADGNNEHPVVAGVEPNDALKSLGKFESDAVNVSAYGYNQAEAQKIFDAVGWN